MINMKSRSAQDHESTDWTSVIARCLAYLCLKQSDHASDPKLKQAKFLAHLGLPKRDSAAVVGTSVDSLRVLASRAKKKKGAKKNGTRKRC